jgi:hypothetical protein
MKYWDYKGWVGIENYDQEMWNFRLHIEINKCSARLFKKHKINSNSIISNKNGDFTRKIT